MPDLLDALPVSREEKIAALKREIGYRETVYPRRVAAKKMSKDLADRQLRIMRAILADYEEAR